MYKAVIVFLFFSVCGFAQKVNLKWAYDFGKDSLNLGSKITTDQQGNTYATGSFYDTVDFDPGVGKKILISKYANAYIVKFDTVGKLIWAIQTDGDTTSSNPTGYCNVMPSSIIVDKNNNTFLMGRFAGTVDFDPGPAKFLITSMTPSNIFLLKIDSNGNFKWVKIIKGKSLALLSSTKMILDPYNNSYLIGYFNDTVDFNPDTGVYKLSTRKIITSYKPYYKFYTRSFILKLDSNGSFKWAKAFGDDSNAVATTAHIIYHNNKLFTFGTMAGIGVDFDPPNKKILIPTGYNLTFLLVLDSGGTYNRVNSFPAFCSTAFIDSIDNICMFGSFGGKRDFDPSAAVYYLNSNTNGKFYFLMLDSAYKFKRASNWGGSRQPSSISSVYFNSDGFYYITGYFSDTTDFNPDTIFKEYRYSKGKEDVYIQKLDINGNFIWVKCFGGIGTDMGEGLAVDKNDIYVTGRFKDRVDFDPDKTSKTIWYYKAHGTSDIFITHHKNCTPYQSVPIKMSNCDSVIYNGKIYKNSGKYFQKYLNVEGCDSFINIDVTVNTKPKSKFTAITECFGKATAFTDSSTDATKRVWFFGDGDTSKANNPMHTYKIAGSFTATLAVMSSTGCVDSSSKTVTVNPNPTATFTTTAKSSKTFDFKATDTTQTGYSWSFGDGINATGFATSHTYTKDSTFTVSLSVTNSFGCTDKKDSNLSVITGLVSITENNFSASIFPNPFKESTNIHYSITQKNHIKIYITDVLGRTVCTLADAHQSAGEYHIDVPRFGNVARLGMSQGGVYFVHFIVGDRRVVERVVMVR